MSKEPTNPQKIVDAAVDIAIEATNKGLDKVEAMMMEKDPEAFKGKGFEPVNPRSRARILADAAERTASETAVRVMSEAQ